MWFLSHEKLSYQSEIVKVILLFNIRKKQRNLQSFMIYFPNGYTCFALEKKQGNKHDFHKTGKFLSCTCTNQITTHLHKNDLDSVFILYLIYIIK